MDHEHDPRLPLLVVGGGVAGMAAALDLASLGRRVHLLERGAHLGGQTARLDKVYPTDHCAFCQLRDEAARCLEHPLVTVRLLTELVSLTAEGDRYAVRLRESPRYVDPDRCIHCGRCAEACPARDAQGNSPARPGWPHAQPPAFWIDPASCDRCGRCVEACPTGCIDLDRRGGEEVLEVGRVVMATGFAESDLATLPEFGAGTHPDIMTAMEFEAWIAEAGPNQGRVARRSDGRAPGRVAFIQCAGSRDKRLFPYCSAVCCMHALKQARWVGRRSPETSCVIFLTDLRTVGKGFYQYARRAASQGLELVRGRPGQVLPLADRNSVAVVYEDTLEQQRLIQEFDMVVLNGGLAMCGREPGVRAGLETSCGFCRAPADVAEAVIQGSEAAWMAAAHGGGES